MANFEFERVSDPLAKIKVIGVGGGGSNAVDSMVEKGIKNVEFYAVNTDAQALAKSKCSNKLQIGEKITGGLGTGGNPELGKKSAIESMDSIKDVLKGTDMLFLTEGLGGGTGTGATPEIAKLAKEMGILSVAIVTRPFSFEGPQRLKKAEFGLEDIRQYVDTLIVVSNDKLLDFVGKKATLIEAFEKANEILVQGVNSISDLISTAGLINVDFADIKAIMGQTGGAVMGVGVGRGENRAQEAVKKACASPLLDKIVIDGAKGVLICFTGSRDITLDEINEATTYVYKTADPDANIIFGAVINEELKDEIRVTIIATGFYDSNIMAAMPFETITKEHPPIHSTIATSQTAPQKIIIQHVKPEVEIKKEVAQEKPEILSPLSGVSLRTKLESMLKKEIQDMPDEDSSLSLSDDLDDETPVKKGDSDITMEINDELPDIDDIKENGLDIPTFLRKNKKQMGEF